MRWPTSHWQRAGRPKLHPVGFLFLDGCNQFKNILTHHKFLPYPPPILKPQQANWPGEFGTSVNLLKTNVLQALSLKTLQIRTVSVPHIAASSLFFFLMECISETNNGLIPISSDNHQHLFHHVWHWPDEHTLAVMALPDATVAFISHSEDVRGELPQMVLGVQVHPIEVVQARDLLVGVHGRQNAADIRLWGEEVTSGCWNSHQFCVNQDWREGGRECAFVVRILFKKLRSNSWDVENGEHFILKLGPSRLNSHDQLKANPCKDNISSSFRSHPARLLLVCFLIFFQELTFSFQASPVIIKSQYPLSKYERILSNDMHKTKTHIGWVVEFHSNQLKYGSRGQADTRFCSHLHKCYPFDSAGTSCAWWRPRAVQPVQTCLPPHRCWTDA